MNIKPPDFTFPLKDPTENLKHEMRFERIGIELCPNINQISNKIKF
jgi:hypothetical protein